MSKPAQTFRVAVAGTGYFSRFHYDAWQRLGVDLVGCCSLDGAQAAEVAAEFEVARTFIDFAKMLDVVQPDIVDIVTPPPTHAGFIRAALDRAIPIVCQKPFTASLGEATAVVEEAELAGTPLIVHENFRFQPWYLEIRNLLDEGLVGTPYEIAFRMRPGDGQGPDAYLSRQPYFQQMPRFLVHETGVHFVDVFRFLMGEVATVWSDLRRLNPVISGEDAGVIVFAFADGARGVFDANRLADHAAENRRLTMGEMLLEGSKATIRLDGEGRIFVRPHGSNDERAHDYGWTNTGFAGDSVYRLQAHVLAHLAAHGPLHNNARDYLTNLRIVDAIYASSKEGRRIDVVT